MSVKRLAAAQMSAGLHYRPHRADSGFRSQEFAEKWDVVFNRLAFGRTLREAQQTPGCFVGPGDFAFRVHRENGCGTALHQRAGFPFGFRASLGFFPAFCA